MNTRRNLIIGLIIFLLIIISIEYLEWMHISGVFSIAMPFIEIGILVLLSILIWFGFRDSARKIKNESQDLLKNSEDRYKMIVETAHEGIWMVDRDNVTTFVNNKMAEMLGYTKEEMLGRTVFDFIDETGKEIARENLRRRKEGIAEELEFRFLTRSGKEVWTQVSSTPLFENGEYNGVLAMINDITSRKKALDDIRRSNESFLLISRTTNDAVWEWNLETNELWANERNQQLYGLTMSDPVPTEKMWAERIHPDDRDKIIQRQKETLASDQHVFISEYRFNTADKGYRDLYDRCYIVRNKKGKPIRMTGSMMDVTESKKVEAALKSSEENLRQVLSSTADVFYVIDRNYRVTLINEIASKNLRQVWGNPVYQGTDILTALPLDKRESVKENYDRAFAGESIEYDVANTIDGKLSWVRVNYMPVSDQTGTIVGVYVVSKDITARKTAEEAVKDSEQRYRSLIEQASDFIMITDTSGNFMDANSSFFKTFGYSKDELVQLNISHVIDPEQLRVRPVRFDLLMKGQSILNERRMLTRSGEFIDVEANVKMLPDGRVLAIARDIRERTMAEKALAESENRLRTIISSEPQCIKLLDQQCRLLDMNPAGLAMIEADSLDMVKGHSVVAIVDEIYREPFVNLVKDVFKDRSGTLVFSITGLHGTKRWLETHAVPMKDAEGQIISLLGVTVDITARRIAEEELRRNEEKYRTLVEQAVDAIALYDANGRILDVNTGSANLLGYTKEELMQMALSDVLTREEIEEKPVRYDVLQKGESTVKQRRMRRKDGVIIETEVRSQQLPDGRFLSVIRDLSERIKAQKLIEEEKKLSDKLIDSLPGIFYWYDENGRFLRWNRQFEVVTGYSGQEIAGMHPIDFFEGNDKYYIAERIGKVFTEGESDAEADFVSKDGSKRSYYFKAVRIDYDNRPCLLGTGIDISDRKKAEKELETSNETLRTLTMHLQNIREEERSHIAREIHDELGQQLTVLKMDISWLNKKIESDDEKVQFRMRELVGMIDTTVRSVRKISSELRPSMLDDLGLPAALEWQGQEFEKRSGIKVKMSLHTNDLKLPNNIAITLFRIFQESCTNVARHSNATEMTVSLRLVDQHLQMIISDNGEGFVVKGIENKKTLGILGMRERMTIINGEYNIDSTPGSGTSVRVSVPLESIETY